MIGKFFGHRVALGGISVDDRGITLEAEKHSWSPSEFQTEIFSDLRLSINFQIGTFEDAQSEAKDSFYAESIPFKFAENKNYRSTVWLYQHHLSFCTYLSEHEYDYLAANCRTFASSGDPKSYWGQIGDRVIVGEMALGRDEDLSNKFFDGKVTALVRGMPRVSFVFGGS